MDPNFHQNIELFGQFMNFIQANGSPFHIRQQHVHQTTPTSTLPNNRNINSVIHQNDPQSNTNVPISTNMNETDINSVIHQNYPQSDTNFPISRILSFGSVSTNIPVSNQTLSKTTRKRNDKSTNKRTRSKSSPTQPINKSLITEQIEPNVISSTKISWLIDSKQEKYFIFVDKETIHCIPCGVTFFVKNKSQFTQHLENKSHPANIEEFIKLNILPFEENLKEHQKTKLRMFLVCIFTGMSFYSATKYRKFFKLIMNNYGHLSSDYQTLTENASIIYTHLKLLLQGLFKDKTRYVAIQFDGSSYFGYEVNNIIAHYRVHDKTFQFLLSMCFDNEYPDAETLSDHLVNTVKEFDISPTQICSLTSDDAPLCASTRTRFKIKYQAEEIVLLKDLCHPLDSIMKDVFSFSPISTFTSSVTMLFKKSNLSIIQSFKNYFIEKVKGAETFSKIYFPKKPKAWNSTYLMLSKMVKVYQLKDKRKISYLEILYEWLKNEETVRRQLSITLQKCLDAIENEGHKRLQTLLEVIVVHLRIIYDWIDSLQGSKYVLIHKVKEIINEIDVVFNINDFPLTTKEVYETKTKFFTPYKKNLLKHFKEVVVPHAKSLLKLYEDDDLDNLFDVVHLCDPIQAKQNRYKIKFKYNSWEEVLKKYISVDDKSFKSEFELYQNKIKDIIPLQSKTTNEMLEMTKLERYNYWLERCPRKWWLENYNEFPKMAKAVLTVFDIGVSSAESERSHSATRLLLKPQRSSLSPSLIEKIRFIQQNLFFFYPDLFEKDYKHLI